MGHDLHFLERLERVNPEQQQIALTLYRDPELVRLVIDGVDVASERVAIALDEAEDGPHIIVARDGAFVTCLAAGMSPRGLWVISRAELDANAHWLDRWERPDPEQQRGVEEMLARFFKGGATPSRAHMARIERFGAFYYSAIVAELSALICELDATRGSMLRSIHGLRRASKHRALVEETARLWWDTRAGCAHRLVACGICISQLAPARRWRVDLELLYEIALHCANDLTPMSVLRAAWLCAVVGPPMLPFLLERLEGGLSSADLGLPLLALVALGCRHNELLHEVHAHVQQRLDELEQTLEPEQLIHEYRHYTYVHAEGALRHRDASLAQRALLLAQRAPLRAPEWAEDLIDPHHLSRFHEEATSALLHTQDQFMTRLNHLSMILLFIPAIAPLDGPALYPERPILAPSRAEESKLALSLALRLHQHQHRATVARAQPQPGRNEPCACGSGKKYKKCCGVAA